MKDARTLLFCALLSACGATAELTPALVLAQLQLRDARLVIHGGHGEPRFSVVQGGKVIAEGLSLDALRAQQPGLYRAYQSAVVRSQPAPSIDSAQRSGAPSIDASLTQLPTTTPY